MIPATIRNACALWRPTYLKPRSDFRSLMKTGIVVRCLDNISPSRGPEGDRRSAIEKFRPGAINPKPKAGSPNSRVNRPARGLVLRQQSRFAILLLEEGLAATRPDVPL